MKNILLAAVGTALLLQTTSCINTEREAGNAKIGQKTYTPTPEDARTRVTDRSILRTVNATHYFTNTKSKDNFILQLRGTKVVSSQAQFVILSSTGDTIRKETMPASTLLDEQALEDPRAATVRDKEIAILKGMNAFFSEDRFTKPAVPRKAVAPADVDAQAWSLVQADTKAIGFDYKTAGGKERRIAYAKKLQKAVVVAN